VRAEQPPRHVCHPVDTHRGQLGPVGWLECRVHGQDRVRGGRVHDHAVDLPEAAVYDLAQQLDHARVAGCCIVGERFELGHVGARCCEYPITIIGWVGCRALPDVAAGSRRLREDCTS
jgi:hypothetical protein